MYVLGGDSGYSVTQRKTSKIKIRGFNIPQGPKYMMMSKMCFVHRGQ